MVGLRYSEGCYHVLKIKQRDLHGEATYTIYQSECFRDWHVSLTQWSLMSWMQVVIKICDRTLAMKCQQYVGDILPIFCHVYYDISCYIHLYTYILCVYLWLYIYIILYLYLLHIYIYVMSEYIFSLPASWISSWWFTTSLFQEVVGSQKAPQKNCHLAPGICPLISLGWLFSLVFGPCLFEVYFHTCLWYFNIDTICERWCHQIWNFIIERIL